MTIIRKLIKWCEVGSRSHGPINNDKGIISKTLLITVTSKDRFYDRHHLNFFDISTDSFCIELLKLSSVKSENSKTNLHILLLLKPIWLEFSDTKKTYIAILNDKGSIKLRLFMNYSRI